MLAIHTSLIRVSRSAERASTTIQKHACDSKPSTIMYAFTGKKSVKRHSLAFSDMTYEAAFNRGGSESSHRDRRVQSIPDMVPLETAVDCTVRIQRIAPE
jgi:hypothetical protein